LRDLIYNQVKINESIQEKELRKEKHEKKGTPIGTKVCASHVALAAPFVPVARPGTKGPPSFCPGLAFPVGKPGQQGFPNRDKLAFV